MKRVNFVAKASATADRYPMVTIAPLSKYSKGFTVSAVFRASMTFPTYVPSCLADWAMPGTLFNETMSPMANTSGRPGRVQSGSAGTRPARSVSTPVARASIPTAARQVGRLLQCDVRVEGVLAKLHVGRLLGNGGLGVGCVCVGSLVGHGDLPCLLTRQYASDE